MNFNPMHQCTQKDHAEAGGVGGEMLFGRPELFVRACFIYFHFNTGVDRISKHGGVNTAGNPRGYFEMLL